MPAIDTEVLTIAYDDLGPAGGPVVFLLHGWPDSPRGWRFIAPALVESGWRVVMPGNRGTGETRFRSPETVRDGQAVALAQDALDLADSLGIERFAVVGHDWGARTAYTLAAVAPHRLTAIAGLALAYQPRGVFSLPEFSQAQAFWYQWLMYVDAGAAAVRDDPLGFARRMWDTWSPRGWYDETEFTATAADFENPDWVPITLNAYRSRFLAVEPRDPRYDPLREQVRVTDRLPARTLMIQGGSDSCDEPESSEGQDRHFDDYRREVLPGVGHFPHRESPAMVAELVLTHLGRPVGG